MIRVGILSYWHVHAADYARQVREHPDTVLSAVWDEIPERGRDYAGPLAESFETLEQLLADPDIDAVIVTTATKLHRDVMVKAAAAGKHIFSEKVLALTLRECNEIVAAVNQSGVKLTVSLPHLNFGYARAMRKIVDEGLLGELTSARVRMSHNGATAGSLPDTFFDKELCGGGALIDLGCHPMYMAGLLLGMPDSVSAHYGYMTGKEVEDNAVAVLKYASGALGIVEAGFVNSQSPFCIELHGTDGTAMYGYDGEQVRLRSSRSGEEAAGGWQFISPPEELPTAFHQWVEHIKNGTAADENIRRAVELTMLMEASNLSASRGTAVNLSDLND